MTTYGDFFTGGGGMTIGAKQAGYDVLFGIEYDADIAGVYRRNLGDHVIVADVATLDMTTLPRVDVFHASPPCTRASVASAAGESELDSDLARAVCRYIAAHLPDVVTLENVYRYRVFKAWALIERALSENGYQYKYWHVNMADHGVPQTRKRMIVVAHRDGRLPSLPASTHARNPKPSLFGTLSRWVSWHDAIEDLIPTLPESQFAPWQLERLPDEFRQGIDKSFMVNRQTQGGVHIGVRDAKSRAFTIGTGGHDEWRAFIMNGANPNSNETKKYRLANQSAKTVTSDIVESRAFVINGTPNDCGASITVAAGDEPIYTQTSSHDKRPQRASINGRVVKMTPRAIARFQSFPDWYELPDRKSLAVKVLGNAVPPLFAEKLYKRILRG